MLEITWQQVDFWATRKQMDLTWSVGFAVATGVSLLILASWGVSLLWGAFAAIVSDLGFAGAVLSNSYLGYRRAPIAVGFDKTTIHFRWRHDYDGPNQVSLLEVAKMEISGSKKGGLQIFPIEGSPLLVDPSPGFGSTFFRGLLAAWNQALETKGDNLVTKRGKFFLESVYLIHPSSKGPPWSYFSGA